MKDYIMVTAHYPSGTPHQKFGELKELYERAKALEKAGGFKKVDGLFIQADLTFRMAIAAEFADAPQERAIFRSEAVRYWKSFDLLPAAAAEPECMAYYEQKRAKLLKFEKPEWANQRPDGTSAKAPPSNPSQGAAVPHP